MPDGLRADAQIQLREKGCRIRGFRLTAVILPCAARSAVVIVGLGRYKIPTNNRMKIGGYREQNAVRAG